MSEGEKSKERKKERRRNTEKEGKEGVGRKREGGRVVRAKWVSEYNILLLCWCSKENRTCESGVNKKSRGVVGKKSCTPFPPLPLFSA